MSASLLVLIGLCPWAVIAQGQQQGMEPPKWMTDEGKDLFTDLMQSDQGYDEATCETRESLLKTLMGISHQESGQFRYMVLKDLGMCEFAKGNYDKSKKRFDSGVSELNLRSDDMMATEPQLMPVEMLRQAAAHMKKFELTQAGTALRRGREVGERNLKKIIKMLHKQMSQQGGAGGNIPPVDTLLDEISGFGKTGQILPQLMKQAPILKQEFPFLEQTDKAIEELDKKLAGFAPQAKTIRKTLDTSKGSKAGSLLYVRALVSEGIGSADGLMAATALTETGAAAAFKEEGAKVEKSLTLLKRTKEGTGCKGKGMDKTCEALAKIPDLKSNSFGETRVLVLKPGKKQQLEVCSTNANVGIILAAGDGVTAQVGASTSELLAGLPKVIDFCQESSLEASKPTAVLFAQAWHPEFAAVERTTEVRARAKNFGLSEDEVKEATKIINDNAKKNWDKSAKQWREGSKLIEGVKASLQEEKDGEAKKAEAAAEAKRLEDEANDEVRKKNLEALEAKRAAKRKAEQDAEEKRKLRKKQLEEERANRDPWLNDPTVLEAEKTLNDLKESRREANAKLEFDLTAQLTKDISAAERTLKKVTKAARKAFKKGGGQASAPAKPEETKADKGSNSADKVAELKKQIEDVKKQKAEAADSENFKEAKKLKEKQKDLEDQLKKLEL